MTQLLDHSNAQSVANTVVDALEEAGYTFEEAIPGLVQAIIAMARVERAEEQILDEAMNLLADGGVRPDESWYEEAEDVGL